MDSVNRPERGLLDTSVIIDLEEIPASSLPVEHTVSIITMAELAAGPYAADDPDERRRREDRFRRVADEFDPVPFDENALRACDRVFAAVANVGRKPGGNRAVDLFIAATAVAHGLPLYTRNQDDFRGLDGLVEIITV